MSEGTVTALSLTPVKGTRLHTVESVQLDHTGARGDRCFFLIDQRDRLVNAKTLGALQTVIADFDEVSRRLKLTLPSGDTVEDVLGNAGAELEVRFYSSPRPARLVDGPWSEAMSEVVGQPLRLVDGGPAVDRGAGGAVSLVSRASLARLAAEAGVDDVDARRFRMLIEIDGVPAHHEDGWVGQAVQLGSAVVGFEGHVGRCLITSRDPESGEIDLATLDVLRGYRGDLNSTEPLPFGVYGRVLSDGAVSVGDSVALTGG